MQSLRNARKQEMSFRSIHGFLLSLAAIQNGDAGNAERSEPAWHKTDFTFTLQTQAAGDDNALFFSSNHPRASGLGFTKFRIDSILLTKKAL
jgi:hypothetical protein